MIGSEHWLKEKEIHFGGFHTGVNRNKISPLLPKDAKLNPNGMTGGDRMTNHKYAKNYARYLSTFVQDRFKPYTIVECGILKGTGLAIWSILFPNATLIGLDIDLDHIKNNIEFLKSKGAFETGNLELYEYDQFANNTNLIKEILKNRKIDIAIDDGFHSDYSILNTFNNLSPYLNDLFCYFIEDNKTVYPIISNIQKYNKVYYHKQLTIISNV